MVERFSTFKIETEMYMYVNNGNCMSDVITTHTHARAGGFVIGAVVHIYICVFVDKKN